MATELPIIPTKQSRRYINKLTTMTVGPMLLASGVYPNAKEITESFAAYNATVRHISRFSLDDPSVTAVCVGDGSTPRTALAFVAQSAWETWSVDPAIRSLRRWTNQIPPQYGRRMTVSKNRIEDVLIHATKAVIIAVHSHANLQAAVDSVDAKDIAVVALPCCVPQTLDRPPDYDYRDPGIWSPCNRVLIWEKVP